MGEWGNCAHRSRNLSNFEMGTRIRSIKASLKMNPIPILCFSVYCSLLLVSIALLVMLDREKNKQGIAFHRKSCLDTDRKVYHVYKL